MPGTATQHGSWSTGGHQGGTSTAYVEGVINFERLMRATPTITLYDHNGNSNKCARLATGVARYQNESISTSQVNARGITMYSTTGTAAGIVQGHYTAGNTNTQTWRMKGYSYTEGNNPCYIRFIKHHLIIWEVEI